MNTLQVVLSDDQLDDLAARIAVRLSHGEPESKTDQGLVTIEDVCNRLNVARSTVYQMRRRGELEAVHIGRAVRFRPEDVDQLLEK